MSMNECCMEHVRVFEVDVEKTFVCSPLKILDVDACIKFSASDIIGLTDWSELPWFGRFGRSVKESVKIE